MNQRAQCRTCGEDLLFGNDGNGKVTETCPVCVLGWKPTVRPRFVSLCRHSEPEGQCARCARHAESVRAGQARYLAEQAKDKDAAYKRRRQASLKAWQTMRARGGRAVRVA